ncbi:MAG TPA: hypothetical protein VLE53_19475 [Gemmatimonadaceae bacterium]|nr:hypothetical protein [Gemmatimonadaceae bacterium]
MAALLGATVTVACPRDGELVPCGGRAMDGAVMLKEAETSSSDEAPCLVTFYGDSIGTDTSTQTTQYSLDSIGTDTLSASARGPCAGRFLAGAQEVAAKSVATDGPCRLRAYVDSIGTDTLTGSTRVLYRIDSIGTDTSSQTR